MKSDSQFFADSAPMKKRVPGLAHTFTQSWLDQRDALKTAALPYIDSLIDELLLEEDLTKSELQRLLTDIIPRLQADTARSLIDLKFPDSDNKTVLCSPRN